MRATYDTYTAKDIEEHRQALLSTFRLRIPSSSGGQSVASALFYGGHQNEGYKIITCAHVAQGNLQGVKRGYLDVLNFDGEKYQQTTVALKECKTELKGDVLWITLAAGTSLPNARPCAQMSTSSVSCGNVGELAEARRVVCFNYQQGKLIFTAGRIERLNFSCLTTANRLTNTLKVSFDSVGPGASGAPVFGVWRNETKEQCFLRFVGFVVAGDDCGNTACVRFTPSSRKFNPMGIESLSSIDHLRVALGLLSVFKLFKQKKGRPERKCNTNYENVESWDHIVFPRLLCTHPDHVVNSHRDGNADCVWLGSNVNISTDLQNCYKCCQGVFKELRDLRDDSNTYSKFFGKNDFPCGFLPREKADHFHIGVAIATVCLANEHGHQKTIELAAIAANWNERTGETIKKRFLLGYRRTFSTGGNHSEHWIFMAIFKFLYTKSRQYSFKVKSLRLHMWTEFEPCQNCKTQWNTFLSALKEHKLASDEPEFHWIGK